MKKDTVKKDISVDISEENSIINITTGDLTREKYNILTSDIVDAMMSAIMNNYTDFENYHITKKDRFKILARHSNGYIIIKRETRKEKQFLKCTLFTTRAITIKNVRENA